MSIRFAVSMQIERAKEPRDALNHSYLELLARLEIEPVLVPNTLDRVDEYLERLQVDGIVLTGGNDIGDPGDTAEGSTAEPARDLQEARVLAFALSKNLPVLGICRGMQFLNAYFGGRLTYNLAADPRRQKHAGEPHEIRIVTEAFGAYLGTNRLCVNSFHKHGVTTGLVAPTLEVFAVSVNDDVIEGIVHPSKPVLGVQWHPERSNSEWQYDERLLQGFLSGDLWRARRV